ncbi:MAG: hypothetical protein K9L30_14660 [Desulfobacterales bacterium]|nr:hypothetical protein [Desulfobacterales bacterium]
METCETNSDSDTGYLCMKHHIWIPNDNIHCHDPELYCKYRTSCLIWFMDKRNGHGLDENPQAG